MPDQAIVADLHIIHDNAVKTQTAALAYNRSFSNVLTHLNTSTKKLEYIYESGFGK
jgi:hypothetical protein